jgi:protein SCO1/2
MLRRRDALALVALLAVAGAVAGLLIHSPAKPRVLGAASVSTSRYAGLAVEPPKPAPPLALRNYLGTEVNIDQYRHRAVLVTFLYTHCPDVCPLITSQLHTTLTEMPAAMRRRLAIIAVSVDPRGDTPATVAQFLGEHEMTGRMQYLIGSAAALGRVWAAWGISAQRDSNPDVVAHSALIYGITGDGRIATVYPSNFTPSQIIHDVPRLAAA